MVIGAAHHLNGQERVDCFLSWSAFAVFAAHPAKSKVGILQPLYAIPVVDQFFRAYFLFWLGIKVDCSCEPRPVGPKPATLRSQNLGKVRWVAKVATARVTDCPEIAPIDKSVESRGRHFRPGARATCTWVQRIDEFVVDQVQPTGVEPVTFGFVVRCSIQLS